MYSSKGGQRRTIETTCGWTTKCHPREANGKYKIHIRHCSICVEQDLPEYNRTSAKLNGWKGLMPNGNKPTIMRTSAVIEGVRNDLVVEATNMEDAMVNTKLTAKILQKIDNVQHTTCEAQCNNLPNCTGFISNIPYNTDLNGNCTFYNTINRNINNMKYDVNNNLYIK
jgi:hypothetical protein